METTCGVVAADISDRGFPLISIQPHPSRSFPWLLELEIDRTIRYSNIHPQNTLADGGDSVVGANFFELAGFGDLRAFRRDFVSFVKSGRNRQTFHMSAANGPTDGHTVVLTRSFDTTEAGPPNGVIVLMELKTV